MALQPKQYATIAVYRKHAGLDEATYRDVLVSTTGKVSPKLFNNSDFDQLMAVLEAIVFDRVRRGAVPPPKIKDSLYWRHKYNGGGANSRQIHKIRELWGLLTDYLPPEQRTEKYLHGMIQQACGRPHAELLDSQGRLCWTELRYAEVDVIIPCLKDRLRQAVGGGKP